MQSMQSYPSTMEYLTFDDFDASIDPANICLQCGSQVQDCFCLVPACSTYPTASTPSLAVPPRFFSASPAFTQSTQASSSKTSGYSPPAPLEPPCTCLREAMLVSEQLHYHQQAMANMPFDQTLSIARRAVYICGQYLRCKDCVESLNSILCLNALQQASACYRYLVNAKLAPENEGRPFRCRIGSFHADVTLQEDTWRAILGGEINRALRSVAELEGLLREGEEGASGKGRGMDEMTIKYHQGLLGGVARELAESSRLNDS